MTDPSAFLRLANRVENEPASYALDCEIGAAVHNMLSPGTVVQKDGQWVINRLGSTARPMWEVFRPRAYTSNLEAAADLAPGDAAEVCVRLYANGGAYVTITLADGRCVRFEAIDRGISEARARTAAALRAMAATACDPPTRPQDAGTSGPARD